MPAPEAGTARAEAQVRVHLQGREADVDAVEVGDDVEDEQERDQPPARAGQGPAADVFSGRGRRGIRHAASCPGS